MYLKDSQQRSSPNSRLRHPSQSATPNEMLFNKWITCPHPRPLARFRLFCLPFAGGGASVFRLWGKSLPTSVEVCPIQLPGREERVAEPLCTNIHEVTEHLTAQIRPYLTNPFGFFGHSMGALIAFELARSLRRLNAPLPQALFLSAHRAPHLPLKRKTLHQLPERDFIRAVRLLGGTPAAVFEHQELLDFVLPTLRADFTICDTYRFAPEPPLDCSFTLSAGVEDSEAPPQDVAAWEAHTSKPCRLWEFPGNHFFLHAHRDLLLQTIAATIDQLIAC